MNSFQPGLCISFLLPVGNFLRPIARVGELCAGWNAHVSSTGRDALNGIRIISNLVHISG